MKIFIYVALLAFFPACSTLGEKGCRTADWGVQGQLDAEKGHERVSRFESLRSECQKYKVDADLRGYTSGYELGLKTFCTPSNGWSWGAAGNEYKQICPPDVAPKFLEGYRLGYQKHSLAQMISTRKNEMERLEKLMSDLEASLPQRTDARLKMGQLGFENKMDEIKMQELESSYSSGTSNSRP